jgi:hypothetical protein
MSHADDPNLPIIVAVVSGLFALLGAFIGAWLGRRSEYEKWLRQNKSETFAHFLELISAAQKDAIDALHDSTSDHQQQDLRVTEVYLPALEYGRVVRLYLQENKREQFSELAKSVYVLHSDRTLGDSRLTKMNEKLRQIQELFERELHDG